MGRRKKEDILPFEPFPIPPYNAATARENNSLGQCLAEARRCHGLSLSELSTQLVDYGIQIGGPAISKWEMGRSVPDAYQLLALCCILDLENILEVLPTCKLPLLNDEGQQKVEAYRMDLAATGLYRPAPPHSDTTRYVEMPVYTLAVSAGTGDFLDDDSWEMVSFPESAIPQTAEVGIRVNGDSMEPVYHDGQIVWVHRCETLHPGDVGIFLYDGEGYLKSYGEQMPEEGLQEAFTDSNGQVHPQPVLISFNQAYPPRPVSPYSPFRIVGKVL